jgi:hypothetical protein
MERVLAADNSLQNQQNRRPSAGNVAAVAWQRVAYRFLSRAGRRRGILQGSKLSEE